MSYEIRKTKFLRDVRNLVVCLTLYVFPRNFIKILSKLPHSTSNTHPFLSFYTNLDSLKTTVSAIS